MGPVRFAKSVPLNRLILRTERLKAARTAAQRERRRESSAEVTLVCLLLDLLVTPSYFTSIVPRADIFILSFECCLSGTLQVGGHF